MKKFTVIFTVSVLIIAILSFFAPMHEASAIYNDIIRLHVIANSDSTEDQNLKLLVRDKILLQVETLLSGCQDTESACEQINAKLTELTQTASDVISENGYEYNIETSLTIEYYPTKEYEDLTLPCGEYKSVRIVIGEGKGENWWCVLFPPVCTGSASAKEELAETGFTTNQIKLITDSDDEKYTVRFKCLEYFSEIKHKIKELFS